VPTETGAALARYGEMIRAANQAATTAAASVGSVKAEQLRIATTSLISEFFLVEPLAAFMNARADIACHLRVGTIEELVRMVALGEADVGLGQFGTLLDRDGLHLDHLIDDCLTIVARSGHPLCRARDAMPRMLREACWALPESDQRLRWEIETALRYSGIDSLDLAYETATTTSIIGILRASDCVSMLPRFALSPLIARGDLVELCASDSLPRRPIGILSQVERRKSPVVASFIRALRRAARVTECQPGRRVSAKKNGGPDTLGRR
jgi:DNA-binding transcriptional LysR family regulator